MTGVQPCRYCDRPVVLRQLVTGKARPFNQALAAAADVPEEQRYVPVPSGRVVVMVPATNLSERRLEGVRWYAELHTCVQWLRAQSERRYATDSLADVAEDVFAVLAGEKPYPGPTPGRAGNGGQRTAQRPHDRY